MSFHYVYILESADREHFYVGLTEDLHSRLRKHNAGEVPHTAKFKPSAIKTALAFRYWERAATFERHLKSGSGRAFARNFRAAWARAADGQCALAQPTGRASRD